MFGKLFFYYFRVEIFNAHAKHYGESVYAPFFNLLNRQDGFITNQVRRAGWSWSRFLHVAFLVSVA